MPTVAISRSVISRLGAVGAMAVAIVLLKGFALREHDEAGHQNDRDDRREMNSMDGRIVAGLPPAPPPLGIALAAAPAIGGAHGEAGNAPDPSGTVGELSAASKRAAQIGKLTVWDQRAAAPQPGASAKKTSPVRVDPPPSLYSYLLA